MSESRTLNGVNRPEPKSTTPTSHMPTIPANLYLFLRWVEFPGFGENFDEAAGNASEQAA
jgi:hypothetical protein